MEKGGFKKIKIAKFSNQEIKNGEIYFERVVYLKSDVNIFSGSEMEAGGWSKNKIHDISTRLFDRSLVNFV